MPPNEYPDCPCPEDPPAGAGELTSPPAITCPAGSDPVDPGIGTLTVEEDDGAPSVANVSTLQFHAPTFVVSSPGVGTALVNAGWGTSIQSTGTANAAGTSELFARVDHVHNWAGLTARRNAGVAVGPRRQLAFVEGTNVTITVADDSGSGEIDVTIAATAGSIIVRELDLSPVTSPCTVINVDQDQHLTWTDLGGGAGTLGWTGITCLEALTTIATRRRLNVISGVLTTAHAADDSGNACVTIYWDWDGLRTRLNGGTTYTRRRVNFIEGAGVDITHADDAGDDEVDVTFAVRDYDLIASDRRDFYYHKSVTGTGSGTRTYVAGVSAGLASGGTAALSSNTIYAVPFCHPKPGEISSIAMVDLGGAGGTDIVVGVYEATSDTDLYPAALIDYAAGTTAAGSVPTVINVTAPVDGTKLYYIAIVADTFIPTVFGLGANGIYPVLGVASLGGGTGVCFIASHTYDGTLPDPFPGAATIGTGTANSVALGVTLSS